MASNVVKINVTKVRAANNASVLLELPAIITGGVSLSLFFKLLLPKIKSASETHHPPEGPLPIEANLLTSSNLSLPLQVTILHIAIFLTHRRYDFLPTFHF